jgi:hypothetical protein
VALKSAIPLPTLKLEQISNAAREISSDPRSIDPGVISMTLDLCGYDAARAAQILINLDVKQVCKRSLEQMPQQYGST